MLTKRVRLALKGLDEHFRQEGAVAYRDLEKRLARASRRGDDAAEAELALEMGLRLFAMASVLQSLAGTSSRMLPSADEVLEPAVTLIRHASEAALRAGDARLARSARVSLAKCLQAAGQFGQALEQLALLHDSWRMPEDRLLLFEAAQVGGGCCLEQENDPAALAWYELGLNIARLIDDPLEISVQLGKVGGVLGNLRRYDEALLSYEQSRELLVRLGDDEALRRKVCVHRNTFNSAALPDLIAYVDEHVARARDALGRSLLRDLPKRLATWTQAAMTHREVPPPADWAVFRRLDVAVRSATQILADLLDPPPHVSGPAAPGVEGSASALATVGDLCRRHFDRATADPPNLVAAARYLMQIDRSRRAALTVRRAERSTAGPGPFGGGSGGHAIYLRSFVAGARLPQFDVAPWGMVGLEELLACLLDEAPLIALGDADIEEFGPGRAASSDENWRRVLRMLAVEAQMLVVIPAPTPSTSWEIEWVTTNKFLHKTCFVMPPPPPGEEAWWAEKWAVLGDWAADRGLNLPEYRADGCLFRLTTEGQTDVLDFSALHDSTDLRATVMSQLFFRPVVTFDFLYAMQQSLEADRQASDGDPPSTGRLATALDAIEHTPRFELSNWYYDEPAVPHKPGVLLLYETPFRLLWAEHTDDLHDTLDQYAGAVPGDFVNAFLHLKVLPFPEGRTEHLCEGETSLESVTKFRLGQIVSYRYQTVVDTVERENLVELVWSGAARCGAPVLPRPG
ncbi:hypothetical protein ACF1HJ_32930 [Streptomyces sp. NPDC013978]|uniref:hypothetical protein n=1 Tax=Streptomyces sp. NPDC013978 TaxID=3364869 RepID=UPI0036F8BB19